MVPGRGCQSAHCSALEGAQPYRRSAHPGNHRAPQYSCRTSRRRATKAMARWHLGGIGSLVAATDMTMVLQ